MTAPFGASSSSPRASSGEPRRAGLVTIFPEHFIFLQESLQAEHRITATREVQWNDRPLLEVIIEGPSMPMHRWTALRPEPVGFVAFVPA